MLRHSLTFLLWRSGLAALARAALTSSGRFVLEFHGIPSHRFHEIPYQLWSFLDTGELRLILTWIKARFSLLTVEHFLDSDEPGILLTFDDGYANNYTNVLPILEDFEAPAIFFVSTQHLKNIRDWLPAPREAVRRIWHDETNVPNEIATDLFNGLSLDQFKSCANHPLITIGSHTVSHPFLTKGSDSELEDELISSKRFLESTADREVNLFAYPTGDYDLRVIEAVQSAGYRAAFAEDSRNVGVPLFEIPRIGIYSAVPHYLAVKLSGLYRAPIRALEQAVKKGPCEL